MVKLYSHLAAAANKESNPALHGVVHATLHGYLTAALWSSVNEHGEPLDGLYDVGDIADSSKVDATLVVSQFLTSCQHLKLDVDQAGTSNNIGHNLWLTKEGHAVGFWSRDLGELGDKLTELALKFSEALVYLGDDGQIYIDQQFNL